MGSRISTLSINTVADSSVGASLTRSSKRWTLSPWNRQVDETRGHHYWTQLQHEDSGSTFTASAQYPGEPSEQDFLRLTSHYLIEELPDQAMEELVEWLHEMREFYRPGIRQLRTSTEPAAKIYGRLVEQRAASPIYVTEE
jgi:hypothetical protein